MQHRVKSIFLPTDLSGIGPFKKICKPTTQEGSMSTFGILYSIYSFLVPEIDMNRITLFLRG